METDLIGIIAACGVCGFMIVCVAIILGCSCGRRQAKKRLEEDKKASIREWSRHIPPLVATESVYSEGYKLGAYQPKILGKSISQELLINERSNRRTSQTSSKDDKRHRRYSSRSDIRMTEVDGKIISLVEVKHRNGHPGATHPYHNAGYVVPGYMVGDHIYPDLPSKRTVRQGEILVDRQVSETLQGQYVQRSSNGSHVSHVISQQSQGLTSVLPQPTVVSDTVHQWEEQQTFTQSSIDVEDKSRSVLFTSEDEPTSPVTTTTVVTEEHAVTSPISLVTFDSQQTGNATFTAEDATVSPVSRVISDAHQTTSATSEFTDNIGIARSDIQSITTTRVVTEEHSLPSPRQAVSFLEETSHEGSKSSLVSDKVEKIVVGKGAMTNVRIFNEHDGEMDVLRRLEQSHAKHQHWSEPQFEESSRSLIFGEEDGQPISNGTTSYRAVSRVTSEQIQSSTQTESTEITDVITQRDYVIEDYVASAPPQNTTGGAAVTTSSTTFSSQSTEQLGMTKTTRQLVDESAERIPPVFTSTPRSPFSEDPLQTAVTTFVVSPEGVMSEDVDTRRQRPPHDGSIDILPPTPPPIPADVLL